MKLGVLFKNGVEKSRRQCWIVNCKATLGSNRVTSDGLIGRVSPNGFLILCLPAKHGSADARRKGRMLKN